METEKKAVPEVVSLVALGVSKKAFFNECMMTGRPRGLSDEVWVVNKLGTIVKHDMLWRMDDLLSVYKCNEKVYRGGNVCEPTSIHETYTEFLKNHDKPIVTSTAYPDEFPTSIQYPLEDVINTIGYSYFRTTPAYAAAFAIHIGVKRLRIFGCDYVYPTSKYKAEAGRANLEFILGIGMTMGMEVWVPPTSTLLDQCIPTVGRMYGYKEPIEVKPNPDNDKLWKIYPRPDLGKKDREEKQLAEEKQLQKLMLKYKHIVKEDLIDGGWITKDDIDEHFKRKELLDAPEGAVQEESQKEI